MWKVFLLVTVTHHKGLEHSPDLTCFVSNFFPFAGNKFNSFEFISATKGKVVA